MLNVKYVGIERGSASWVPLELVVEDDGEFTYYSRPLVDGRKLKNVTESGISGAVLSLDYQLDDGRWLYIAPDGQIWDADYRVGPRDVNPREVIKIS